MIRRKLLRINEIEKKVDDIISSLEIIEANLPEELEDFLSMGLTRDGLYKKVEFCIESLIDICNIINSDLRFGIPETEEGIIENMRKNNIFTEKSINILKKIKGFRNILVHKYGDINDSLAFEIIEEGLKDFELIIKEIEVFIVKHKKN